MAKAFGVCKQIESHIALYPLTYDSLGPYS